MISTANLIATIISIFFSIISIFFAVKSKKYKEEAVRASQSYEFVKFVFNFGTLSSEFLQKTSLKNWNKGKSTQPCIEKLIAVLNFAPTYYLFINKKDEKQTSDDVKSLMSLLRNFAVAVNEDINEITNKINYLNEVFQKEASIIQSKVARK